MATFDLRPAEANIYEIAGADTSIVVTCFATDGVTPVNISTYTFVGTVMRAGAVLQTFSNTISGAGSNILTLKLTDAQTTALGTGAGLNWSLKVTVATVDDYWYGGEFQLFNAGSPRPQGTGNNLVALVGGSITAVLMSGVPSSDTASSISILDTANKYTGTTVETALAEIAAGTTLDARYANVTGDTFTGLLTIAATNAQLSVSAVDSALIGFETSGGPLNEKHSFLSSYQGDWAVGLQADDYSVTTYPLRILRTGTAGMVTLIGATAVEVPAATAATHAAQVTAIDATTGRLAIGGQEIGDTGLRTIHGSLANGWTGGFGTLTIRRTGNVVTLNLFGIDAAAATNAAFVVIPAGFGPPQSNYFGGITGRPSTEFFLVAGAASVESRAAVAYYQSLTWTTREPWPVALPGAGI